MKSGPGAKHHKAHDFTGGKESRKIKAKPRTINKPEDMKGIMIWK